MNIAQWFSLSLALVLASVGASAKDLAVLSAGAVKPALSQLAPAWEARTGHRLHITYATAGDLRAKLAAGERADVIILPLENFAAVEKDGLTDASSRRDLGSVGIGVAVKAGARVPDLSSEEGLKRALMEAKSITFMDPQRGTSGKHVDEVVLPKLAIRDAVRAKTVLGEGGMIAEKVASGEIEIALQQMTELLPVAGVTVAGALPASLQKTTVYSGAVMKAAKLPQEAAALLGFLVSAEGKAVFVAKGFANDGARTYGPELQGFAYPFELKHFDFESQGEKLRMAYMDVAATGTSNGRAVVLMHGKNFCGATWETSIRALSAAGFRVIAPDQIGFCASTKPAHYQYSFQQLAVNTRALLDKLGVQRATVVGHSTGGMLATRYALLYPEQVDRLAMVNPIGLEDWKALGVPYRTVDQWNERELKLTADSVRKYEQSTYYVGRWKPEYERWVDMLAGLNNGPGKQLVAWNSALIYDMIFTQPVVYEFGLLTMPTLLVIGDKDTTAIGSDIAPPAVKAKLGRYDVLGKQVAKQIPRATLVELAGFGHAPQIEDPERFNRILVEWVGTMSR